MLAGEFLVFWYGGLCLTENFDFNSKDHFFLVSNRLQVHSVVTFEF